MADDEVLAFRFVRGADGSALAEGGNGILAMPDLRPQTHLG